MRPTALIVFQAKLFHVQTHYLLKLSKTRHVLDLAVQAYFIAAQSDVYILKVSKAHHIQIAR